MELSSPDFNNNDYLPLKFTCFKESINPKLKIKNIPPKTKSLVVILDDPDAPKRTFVHWIVFDIPVVDAIEENSQPGKGGLNDYGNTLYGPPCPPKGKVHRYTFHLFALDITLGLKEGISRQKLEEAMKGHILSSTQLIGLLENRE